MIADDSAHIASAKKALRQMLRQRRRAIAEDERRWAELRIAASVSSIVTLARGGAVSGFIALGSEIDPGPLMARLAAAGVPLCLPRVTGEALTFHLYTPGDPLVAGPLGLSEPAAEATQVSPGLMLVPLLGFDRRGNRIGQGKGFYDRAIAALPQAVTIGLAFSAQEVACIPVGPSDRPLDYALTEGGLIDCRAQRGQ